MLNADNLPIAQSVIANNHLEITLRHEMLDTVVGTPMGTVAASAGGAGAAINSSRYVLKQTLTIKNISGAAISNLQLFQFLHGLQSQRGVYDNRAYAGPLSGFRYDVTETGVDAWAVGAGSSAAGLEDFIGFHASAAPSGYELGYYGIEGNGIDNHSMGKPSEGVHLSIEDNWLTAPYSSRLGTDIFAPAQRWVAGTERWNLGNLAANASVSFDVILSVRTGTRVTTGPLSSGGCNGGSSVPGGLDYEFEDATSAGSCFVSFSKADATELSVRIAAGEFGSFNFLTPGGPAQVWEVEFSGTYSGAVNLSFAYDATLLPAGFDESTLAIHHFSDGVWQSLPGVVDPATHKITVHTGTLGAFALGVEGGVSFVIDANVSPANSGSITGVGNYPKAASVTLVAAANADYVLANWTDGANIVSTSPSYTFVAQADRALVANFISVGAAKAISTSSSPANGGATSGDSAYALATSATVVATANPGYKFSKWLVNGATVSSAGSYTFTVAGDRALVAVFKPVYVVTVTHEPAGDFEVEADSPSYELGEKATMKVAHTASGYSFVNWTQNGVVVSTAASFGFTVTANSELVAHFAPGHRIDLLADPKTAGTVSGGGVYAHGGPVTVVTEAKPGYLFTNWTEGGLEVSIAANYNFTFTANRTLVANFLPTLYNPVPVTPTITWAAPAAITYGTALSTTQLNATAGGVAGIFTYNPAVGAILNAGANQTLSLTFTPADTANYTNATATQTLTVNQAALTAKADDQFKAQGAANPALTITYTGFVNAEMKAVITEPSISTTATVSSGLGNYPITLTGGSAANYTLTLINGTLTVLTPYAAWVATKFTAEELADANKSGPNAIYGADGLTNLVKYALGLEPKINISSGLPEVTTTANDWVYTYSRPSSITDVTYAVEISTDLLTWTPNGVTLDSVATAGGIDTLSARFPLASAAKIFFRLKVSLTGSQS